MFESGNRLDAVRVESGRLIVLELTPRGATLYTAVLHDSHADVAAAAAADSIARSRLRR